MEISVREKRRALFRAWQAVSGKERKSLREKNLLRRS